MSPFHQQKIAQLERKAQAAQSRGDYVDAKSIRDEIADLRRQLRREERAA